MLGPTSGKVFGIGHHSSVNVTSFLGRDVSRETEDRGRVEKVI